MPECSTCGAAFPTRITVDGVTRVIGSHRKRCFECAPYGEHNNRKDRTGCTTCVLCGNPTAGNRAKTCPSCRVIAWRRRKKLKAIELLGGSCILCGFSAYPSAMEFHHRNPKEKDFTVVGKTISWDRMVEELKKCVLLCANCHRAVHHGEATLGPSTVPSLPGDRKGCLKCGNPRSVNAVCKRCASAEVNFKVLALHAEGKTVGQIAKLLGLSSASVSFRLHPGTHNRNRKK